MLDVGPETGRDSTDDLIGFVDLLAKDSADGDARQAVTEIRKRIAAGTLPVGLQRLAPAARTTEATSQQPPVPAQSRRPGDDMLTQLSAVLADEPLVVLGAERSADVAAAVADLLRAGRRVLVVASRADELAALRSALPDSVGRMCLGAQPPLSPAELRRLRGLLATATPERLSRVGQHVPAREAVPDPQRVAELCRQAGGGRARLISDLIPGLLGQLDLERRAAVQQLGQWVQKSLDELQASRDAAWQWPLLDRLVIQRDHRLFDQLVSETVQVETALEQARQGEVQAAIVGELPAQSRNRLSTYAEFLDAGGRPRLFMRSPEQRSAEPVLAQIEISGATAVSRDGVRSALAQVELRARLEQIVSACEALAVPPPTEESEIPHLAGALRRVEAAVRAVSALRHDVLFLRADSPVAVPDVATAAEVAKAIVACAGIAELLDPAEELDRLAAVLARLVPDTHQAPEHRMAVDALARHDAVGYAAALDELAAARRQSLDQWRCAELLRTLRGAAPQLVETWDRAEPPLTLGFAVLSTAASLLAQVPPADSADVLVLLGADQLAARNLLLAAVAPRVVAVAPQLAVDRMGNAGRAGGVDRGSVRRAGAERGGSAEPGTVLSVMQAAAGAVLRGQGSGTAARPGRAAGKSASRNGKSVRLPRQSTVSKIDTQRQTPA